ncbi:MULTISPECIES: hypothetical protein [Parageobacillus]|uniref:Uncharacterized protein n=2 Tax=Parageobacillus TaxID=1906945 RepID=A0AAN0YS29_PARTM|nr:MULTISPECIES: hypothetical protein [Parageobacillus]ANZ32330.1 hypothetical protein BCV53_19765 [Parageobacillus thermoglucosidasius]APM83065.1 hypothetical protein BCV54_19785 [Parageobacillus thermoglucosidasius]KJX67576.1 hypothetical protein WH82_16825 [Parageobacillus thermoglucosidasius]MBB3870134.1 hypothetical protein [Parageobacillus toebii NBRC 107807]QIQ34493.1 hypothetical protein DER53_17020 [Parageobacillus toebii NBRC 107807]
MFYIRENQELKGWDLLLKSESQNGEDQLIATFYNKMFAKVTCNYYNRFRSNPHEDLIPDRQGRELI